MSMDIGKTLSSIVPMAAGAAGTAFGGPIGGALASTAAGALTQNLLGHDDAARTQGTAADPTIYALPQIQGYTNTRGIPEIPMPQYQGGPILPYSNPTLPKPIVAPPTQGEAGQGQALNMSKAAMLSMLEPTSPAMRDLTNANSQLGRIDFLKGLRDVMTANRHNQAMGRGGLFQNERQDETLSRMIQNNAQQSDAAARGKAMEQLGGFANNMQSLAGQYGNYAGTTRNRQQDFISQLNNYLAQQRQDAATRNAQMRQDAQGSFAQKSADATNYINTLNRTSPAIASATQTSRQNNYDTKLGMAQPFLNAISSGSGSGGSGGLFGNLFGGSSGGSSGYVAPVPQNSMYASNPWMNPDTGTLMF